MNTEPKISVILTAWNRPQYLEEQVGAVLNQSIVPCGFVERKQGNAIFIFFLLLGITVRVRNYFTDLSLWTDEAALALNLTSRSFAELFKPLDYEQVAPIGFCLIEKISLLIFGNNEYALRLIPLLAGVAAIFLTFKLVKPLLGSFAAILCMAQLAVIKEPIYYATNVKPYASDLFFALALMLVASGLIIHESKKIYLIYLAILGLAAVWFSFPSIFIMGGIGFGMCVFYIRKKCWNKLILLCGIGIIWLISFWIHFQLLKSNVSSGFLKDFWNNYFMPLPPFSYNDLKFFTELPIIFRNPLWTAWAPISIIMFAIGLILLWHINNILFFWVTIPLILNLIASAMQKYPFGDRLLQYGVISLYLPIVICMLWLWSMGQRHRFLKFMAIVLIIANIAEPTINAFYRLIEPRKYEQVKQVMKYIAENPNSDKPIFVYHYSRFTFFYYQNRLGLDKNEVIKGEDWGIENLNLNLIEYDLLKLKKHQLIWILFGHGGILKGVDVESLFIDRAKNNGKLIDKYVDVGASGYLFDFSEK